MFKHLSRHVKETLESLNLNKFVSACGFNKINTRILKSNFGICHQLRNHVSCAENPGIKVDNDDRCGKNQKDSWTHSVHLEHSPIGLLGWSTALAIGWCITQPLYRKSVLPSDRSKWDQAHCLTKTVFAQPDVGLNKLDIYLKYNAANTVFTQTDIKVNGRDNSVSKTGNISLIQSEDSSGSKSECISGSQSECSSANESEHSSGRQSGYSSANESEHSSGRRSGYSSVGLSGYSSGSESEYPVGRQAKKSFGRQAKKSSGRHAKKSFENQSKKNSGSQAKGGCESQTKNTSQRQAKGNSESQAKGKTGTQAKCSAGNEAEAKPHGHGNCCCCSEPLNPKLRETIENLERVHNRLFGTLENYLGVEDIKSGESETAVVRFAQSIALGNRHSMFNMGLCYEMGHGVEKDLTRAAVYYRMAAKRGHLTAIYNLGVFHVYGLGNVTKDPKCALKYFEYAASHGQKEAKNAHSILSSYLEKMKKKKNPKSETDCESNTFPLSSTLSDTQSVQLGDHNTSQK